MVFLGNVIPSLLGFFSVSSCAKYSPPAIHLLKGIVGLMLVNSYVILNFDTITSVLQDAQRAITSRRKKFERNASLMKRQLTWK